MDPAPSFPPSLNICFQKIKFYIAPLLIYIFDLQDPKYKYSKKGA